jgi:hypothetical protein
MALSPTAKKQFRDQLKRFCLVAQKYDNLWHYSQQRPYTGLGAPASDTHYNDCSSYVALAFYKAGRNSGHPISDPLGYHYTGWGNTTSAHATLQAHRAPENKYRIGDVAMYLERSFEHHHMTVCITAGTAVSATFSSFGREAGPEATKLGYRNDLTAVYRHPALL